MPLLRLQFSHVRHQPVDQERFAARLRDRTCDACAPAPARAQVTSIFLGGGTPSLMKPETVGAVLDAVASNWTVPDGIEITLEANPSSVEAGALPRLSRGRRQPRLARRAGAERRRSANSSAGCTMSTEALQAIGLAREIFPRLSFDLIYARPGQTPERWEAELERGDRPCRRPSVALPADHRGRHAVPRAACGEEIRDSRRGPRRRPLRGDAGGDGRARPAGLRDFQPREAGRGKPAQSDLLALWRICRRRAGRAWPLRRERPARRHRRREDAGDLGQPGRGEGPRHHRRRDC